jgi:non-heme Fe2+,alpha-ketoglutarate-dependent halogenase
MLNLLTPAQADGYARDGFLSPVPALSPPECANYRIRFSELEEALGSRRRHLDWLTNLHLCYRWCYELAMTPAVLDAVEDLIGPDVLLLSSIFFVKDPGQPSYVSWHQDGRAYRREGHPVRALSAWIALAPSTESNGCLRVMPGSHLQGYLDHDHTYGADNMLRRGETVRTAVDEAQAVQLPLQAGEMSVHHVYTLHASHANAGVGPRIGLAVRYAPPDTVIAGKHAPAVLARGRDVCHHHELLQEPPSADPAESMAAMTAAVNVWGTQ